MGEDQEDARSESNMDDKKDHPEFGFKFETADDSKKSDMEIDDLTQEDEEAAEKLTSISTPDGDGEPRDEDDVHDAVIYLESLAQAALSFSPSRATTSGHSAFSKPLTLKSPFDGIPHPKTHFKSMLSIDAIVNHPNTDRMAHQPPPASFTGVFPSSTFISAGGAQSRGSPFPCMA